MGPIIAIGGGEIRTKETLPIDREIVSLTGKSAPRTLFLPTASSDSLGYCKIFQEVYGVLLGCTVDNLLLTKESYSIQELEEKILAAELIYVGGGDTAAMLQVWRSLGVDALLYKAHQQGVVLSGLSAGAICWFTYASHDRVLSPGSKEYTLENIKGLGFVNGLASPHHLREPARTKALHTFLKDPAITCPGIAIDDNAAIIFLGNHYKVISSDPEAEVRIVYYEGKELQTMILPKGTGYEDNFQEFQNKPF